MKKLILISIMLIVGCNNSTAPKPEDVYGCDDSTACNYNIDATIDDGSCVQPQGCNEWCESSLDVVVPDSTEISQNGALELDCDGVCGGDAIVDIDGNCYATVQIGEQLWMGENLKVTHYNNGDEIPTGYNDDDWANLSKGAYAIYNDDPSNAEVYGNLYNWFVVDDDRGICPEGFHVPTDEEFMKLEMFLGMSEVEANNTGFRGGEQNINGKLKEIGEEHWNTPNVGATNESGFTALGGGYKQNDSGEYYNMGGISWLITQSIVNEELIWIRLIYFSQYSVGRYHQSKQSGLSVRCLKD